MTFKEILITLAYALWWAMGGWILGIGVNAIFALDATTITALGNVIVGLFLLLPVVANERRRRFFYSGPANEEDSSIWIALLWAFPFIALFVGLLWWLLGRFI